MLDNVDHATKVYRPGTDLYLVEKCTDTFVDACLRDEAGRLLLMSVYGRDTAIRELQAKIQLGPTHQEGLGEIVLKPAEDVGSRTPARVTIGNAKDLDKITGRLPACVYGNLTHMWLFNPVLKSPQKGADVAWVVQALSSVTHIEERTRELRERIWAAVTHLASIPLLPHWRDPVIRALSHHDMLLTMGERGNEQVHPLLSAPIGNFAVCKVQLDQQRLASVVTDLVRRGRLTLEPPAPVAEIPAPLALEHTTQASTALPPALEMA